MSQITVQLDDDDARRLREMAQRHGKSVEQFAQEVLHAVLPPVTPTPHPTPGLPSDDPFGSRMILRMAGSITWPGIEGTVNTTNEKIDRLLAAEAMNPHDDA